MLPVVFQLSAEADLIASIVLAILFFILIYLVLTRVLPKSSRALRSQKAQERPLGKLEQIRAAAHSELRELEAEISHLKQVKMEIRKNYMKGEIDSDAFKHLDRENDHKLVHAQARLHALHQVAKSSQS